MVVVLYVFSCGMHNPIRLTKLMAPTTGNLQEHQRFSIVERGVRFVRFGWRESMLSEANNERFASRIL